MQRGERKPLRPDNCRIAIAFRGVPKKYPQWFCHD
jgi:hypothetical protein